jgi:hypothetical protein
MAQILSVPFATFGVLGKIIMQHRGLIPANSSSIAAVFGFGLNIWEISPSNLTLALKVRAIRYQTVTTEPI